jgi:hypothetical protein
MDNRVFKKPYKRIFPSSKQWHHFKTFGAPKVAAIQFPVSLLAPFIIGNQMATPACSAFSGVDERYGVTGTQYDPQAQWLAECKFVGADPNGADGVTIDQKMQVGIKIGFTVPGGTTPQDAAKCYLWVTQAPGYDWFDSVRLTILQLQQKYGKVIPITIGVNWYQEWDNNPSGFLSDNPKTLLGGHDIEIAGFEQFSASTPNLLLPGTWGVGFGDNGVFRVTREIFNKYFVGYGAAYWSDDATLVPAKLNILVSLLQSLVVLYQRLFAQKSGYPPPIPKPTPVPVPQPPTPPVPVTPTYLWDNQANAEHSVRLICDEEGVEVVPAVAVLKQSSTHSFAFAVTIVEDGFATVFTMLVEVSTGVV